MNNLRDSISSGSKTLSDEDLMELLIKVRNGELSPEQAERLLAGLAGVEGSAEPGASNWTEQTSKRDASAHQTEDHQASAPLGQARNGILIVDALAAHFTIGSTELGPDLFRARYERNRPSVWVDGNRITTRFNYFSLGALRAWMQQGEEPSAAFTLNSAIPWQLELRSHLSHLEVNLHGVQLTGLDGDGNMNHVILTLDKPVGRVPLHFNGNASSLEIRCPAQCPLRVELHGNTNAADIAGCKFASNSAWQTPDFDTTQNGYTIIFNGEVSSLSVIYE